jgi:hypothetical protein
MRIAGAPRRAPGAGLVSTDERLTFQPDACALSRREECILVGEVTDPGEPAPPRPATILELCVGKGLRLHRHRGLPGPPDVSDLVNACLTDSRPASPRSEAR